METLAEPLEYDKHQELLDEWTPEVEDILWTNLLLLHWQVQKEDGSY